METRFRYRTVAGFLYAKYLAEGKKFSEVPSVQEIVKTYLTDKITAFRLRDIAAEDPEILIHLEAGRINLMPVWMSLDLLSKKERHKIVNGNNPKTELNRNLKKKKPKYSQLKHRIEKKAKFVTAEMNQANWYGV
jgi:hypothetical protein